MPASREVLYKSEQLSVVLSETPPPHIAPDTVVVTFHEMGMVADGDDFWGARLFEKLGITCIGFVSAEANWYPAADMLAAIEVVTARIRNRRVVTYGFSQGAYGALKYGRRLGASLALAFSPQWSINPADVETFDKRFLAHYKPGLDNGERIIGSDLAQNSIVAFDPACAPDARGATELLKLPNVHCLPVPFSGHYTIYLITQSGSGRRVAELLLAGKTPPAREFRQVIRAGRRRSATYATNKVEQLMPSSRRHRGYLENTFASMVKNTDAHILEATFNWSIGQRATAREMLAQITDKQLCAIDFHPRWANFRQAKFTDGELRIASLYKIRYKNNIFLRLHGVNSLINAGMAGDAVAELDDIRRIDGAARFREQFIGFYRSIKRADKAIEYLTDLLGGNAIGEFEELTTRLEIIEFASSIKKTSIVVEQCYAAAKLLKNRIALVTKLVETANAVGDYRLSQSILLQALEDGETPQVFQVYLAQCKLMQTSARTTEHDAAKKEILSLLRSSTTDYDYWMKLTLLAFHALGPEKGLEAIRKALPHAGDRIFECELQMVRLLASARRKRATIRYLRRIARTEAAISPLSPAFAEVALENDAPQIALEFSLRSQQSRKNSVQAALLVCKSLRVLKRHSEMIIIIERILELHGDGASISASQFEEMIEFSQPLGRALTRRISLRALDAYPNSESFAMETPEDEFLSQFFNLETVFPQNIAPRGRAGFLGKFGLFRSSQ